MINGKRPMRTIAYAITTPAVRQIWKQYADAGFETHSDAGHLVWEVRHPDEEMPDGKKKVIARAVSVKPGRWSLFIDEEYAKAE